MTPSIITIPCTLGTDTLADFYGTVGTIIGFQLDDTGSQVKLQYGTDTTTYQWWKIDSNGNCINPTAQTVSVTPDVPTTDGVNTNG